MVWLKLRVGGQRWSVHLVAAQNPNLEEDSTRFVGRCVYEKCRIYLSRELDESAREDALLHELLHALLHVTGAEDAYGGSHKKDEHLVKSLTPSLHRLLKDLGFAFPKGP